MSSTNRFAVLEKTADNVKRRNRKQKNTPTSAAGPSSTSQTGARSQVADAAHTSSAASAGQSDKSSKGKKREDAEEADDLVFLNALILQKTTASAEPTSSVDQLKESYKARWADCRAALTKATTSAAYAISRRPDRYKDARTQLESAVKTAFDLVNEGCRDNTLREYSKGTCFKHISTGVMLLGATENADRQFISPHDAGNHEHCGLTEALRGEAMLSYLDRTAVTQTTERLGQWNTAAERSGATLGNLCELQLKLRNLRAATSKKIEELKSQSTDEAVLNDVMNTSTADAKKLAETYLAAVDEYERVVKESASGLRGDGGRITGVCNMALAKGREVASCLGRCSNSPGTCSTMMHLREMSAHQEFIGALYLTEEGGPSESDE